MSRSRVCFDEQEPGEQLPALAHGVQREPLDYDRRREGRRRQGRTDAALEDELAAAEEAVRRRQCRCAGAVPVGWTRKTSPPRAKCTRTSPPNAIPFEGDKTSPLARCSAPSTSNTCPPSPSPTQSPQRPSDATAEFGSGALARLWVHLKHFYARNGTSVASLLEVDPSRRHWLLLVHQVPPQPDYLRVKFRRRLHAVGCVPIKSTVNVLPDTEACREDFEWISREMRAVGGDAVLTSAQLLEGVSDRELEARFRATRETDFTAITEGARSALAALDAKAPNAEQGNSGRTVLSKLKRRMAEVVAIDYFCSDARATAQSGLAALERALIDRITEVNPMQETVMTTQAYQKRTWVTRAGVRVDRMASAWLIRRYIDPAAQFKFVVDQAYKPAPRELRFDMYEGEFTHQGDRCTFEVLLDRFGLTEPARQGIAEIVHDLDLKDSKFDRPETAGVGQMIVGIAVAHERDEDRLARSYAMLDDFLQSFGTQRNREPTPSPRDQEQS